MIKWKKVMEAKDEIDQILCNLCGKEIPKNMDDFEYLEARASWGWTSKNKDGDHWEFHLCEKCAEWLYMKLKIKEGVIADGTTSGRIEEYRVDEGKE